MLRTLASRWNKEKLRCYEAKIEESEKSGSHRESNPGHLACAASALPGLWVQIVPPSHSCAAPCLKHLFCKGACFNNYSSPVHWIVTALAHPSMYRSQTIDVWMVKSLSAVCKHCGYMLNTEFTQVMQLCTLNWCGLYFLSLAFFFLFTWIVICFFLGERCTLVGSFQGIPIVQYLITYSKQMEAWIL